MESSYEPASETSIKVTTPIVTTTAYDLDFLLEQEIAIMRQRDEQLTARERELEEVRILIEYCDNLDIKRASTISKGL